MTVAIGFGHIFWLLAVAAAVMGLGKLKRRLRLLARKAGKGKIR